MKPLRDIYMEHVQLLKQKGYEFANPHSHESIRSVSDSLLFELSKAYNKSILDNRAKLFYVKCEIPFNNSNNKLKIIFNYKYDPENASLILSNLYVTLNKVSSTIFLKGNNELPELGATYAYAENHYLNHPQKAQDDFIKNWNDHIQLLRDKGYDEYGLSNSKPVDTFIRDLEDAFKNALFKNVGFNTPCYFFTQDEGYFNGCTQRVDFKFNYEYNPMSTRLQLMSLEAKMGCRVNFPKPDHQLPSSLEVFQSLNPKLQLLMENEKFLSEHLRIRL